MMELRNEDPASFTNFFRMPPDMFDELLDRVGPMITEMHTRYREALEPGPKLSLTLRHLDSGNKYASMKFGRRVPHNTIAIIDEYKGEAIWLVQTLLRVGVLYLTSSMDGGTSHIH